MPVVIRKPFLAGLVSLCASVGALAFMGTPALAANPPEIAEEQVSSVEATGATLSASIDPNESDTRYHFTTRPAPGSTTADGCPNEQLRAEQPFGSKLPDCRAYEMVSPAETFGQDATDAFLSSRPRSAVSGEAITYASDGVFAEANGAQPTGATVENQYLSQRTPAGWKTRSITPPHDPTKTETRPSYDATAFTSELTAGVLNTNASLGGEGPGGVERVYLANLQTGAYEFVAEEGAADPVGASSDLSHVVVGRFGNVAVWDGGSISAVDVTNTGITRPAVVGAVPHYQVYGADLWHAVSADGSRVYFTTKADEEAPGTGQLYVRVNAERPQSPLASGEAIGAGNLTEGSDTVGSLVTASGSSAGVSGSSELPAVATTYGQFVAGDPISGEGIDPGTTITGVSGSTITLSAPYTGGNVGPGGVLLTSRGPAPFAVGQPITGNGIPEGTTIAAVAAGELTLSAPAAASGAAVELEAGGECTVPADACTVDVSASHRHLLENPAGSQPARYWGASADGSKVFFTSTAELTEDAYTGQSGNAPNLYEYQLSNEPGRKPGRLTDLSVDNAENGGAALGVVQISEDGSYVYFVANGVLTNAANARGEHAEPGSCVPEGRGSAGRCNLYVLHEGTTTFIAVLGENDEPVWNYSFYPGEAGPQVNTAVVNPSGSRLAFVSGQSLTGYDNEQATTGECEGQKDRNTHVPEGERCSEVFLYDAGSDSHPPALECASCDPTGARPAGPASFGPLTDYHDFAEYRSRNLLEDGTLFFDSADALVPRASDGRENVYEYRDGEIHAISNVAGGHESFFLDASGRETDGEEGGNVFFATASQLLPEDRSDNVVVWDARVGGGFPVAAPPPSCENADSCKPPESPQPATFGAPSSATFSGPASTAPESPPPAAAKPRSLTRAQRLAQALRQCGKESKRRRRRRRCVAAARTKYGVTKPGGSTNRSGSR